MMLPSLQAARESCKMLPLSLQTLVVSTSEQNALSSIQHDSAESWCQDEFKLFQCGDKRLNLRIIGIAQNLLEKPLASLNFASENWADAKAAYRFFDNDKVTPDAILKPHQDHTLNRIKNSENVVLAIQDTTYFNYSHHPKTEGLGKISSNQNKNFKNGVQGLILHSAFCVSETGLPLGILDEKFYIHKGEKKENHKNLPISEKESFRWIESLQNTNKLTENNNRVVTVCDRESDIYEFLHEAQQLSTNILIRASSDRILKKVCDEGEHKTLWTHMETISVQGQIEIEVSKKNNLPPRIATVDVRFSEVTIKPPQRSAGAKADALKPVTISAVWICESHPPEGIEALEWMLLTNVKVESFEHALTRMNWYKCRWSIENFHKVLKSGCNTENCRLETFDRLVRYLALKSIIAFRLYWLTHINRVQPNAPCTIALQDHEWKALFCKINRTNQPCKDPPNIHNAVLMIARLGGFLARKGDGQPGITVVWRGWTRLAEIAEDWQLFHSPPTCG